MVLVSEGMRMIDRFDGPGGGQGHGVLPDIRVVMPLDHVVDQAVRAGVVVYALDPRGLQSGRLLADDNTTGLNAEQLPAQAASRHEFLIDTQDSLTHLAEQTGGFAVLNTNDLASGLRRIGDDQRGYYLLGYTPDDSTFAKPGKTIRYHKISVEVKRRGLRVRTHGGFIGVSDDDKRTAPTPGGEIYAAAMSPFTATAVPMRVTAEVGYKAGEGASVHAKLHVDGRALAFGSNTDGKSSAAADILAVIVNADGKIVTSRSSDLAVNRDELDDQSLEAGLVYELQLPVPAPGGYQVRFALRDRRSGALGSAGQFVQVREAAPVAIAAPGATAVAER
jgi:hypothetical protein